MCTVDAITQEVDRRSVDRNQEVSVNAFARYMGLCDQCRYSDLRSDFAKKLKAYADLQILISKRSKSYRLNLVSNMEWQSVKMRQELSEIWPCERCKSIFNPTNALKYRAEGKYHV